MAQRARGALYGLAIGGLFAGVSAAGTALRFPMLALAGMVWLAVANLALATHLSHGAWSLFQSMGWLVRWRRPFAVAFAVVIAAGNVSFPIAVLTEVIK